MKRSELAEIKSLQELNLAIEERYDKWDWIYCYGSESSVSDGCLLNNLRNDISQLIEKKEKIHPSELEGQMDLEGFSKQADRKLPIMLPMDWESPGSQQKRKDRIRARMSEILNG